MLKLNIENKVVMWETLNHPAILERFILRNAGDELVGSAFDGEKGEAKMCFMNATHLAFSEYIEYHEGYCMSEDIEFAFHHAWCVNEDGDILDPTLDDPTKYRYLGVEIPPADLRRVLSRTGVYGVLDYGMINVDYIFERDPELRKIVESIRCNIMGNAG